MLACLRRLLNPINVNYSWILQIWMLTACQIYLKSVILCRILLVVAPSCWRNNYALSSTIGLKKSSIIVWYPSSFTVTATLSYYIVIRHHTAHFSWCSLRWWIAIRFLVAHILFCMFMNWPCSWNYWAESELHW